MTFCAKKRSAAPKARPTTRKTGRSSRKGRRAKSRRRVLIGGLRAANGGGAEGRRSGGECPSPLRLGSSALLLSSSVHRRESRQQLRPRGDPLVEGRIRAEEPAGDLLRSHRQDLRAEALLRRLVVNVDRRQPLAVPFFRVVGERQAQLLLVPLPLLHRAVAEEDRRLAPGHEKRDRAGGAVEDRVVARRLRGEKRREPLEEHEARRSERAHPHSPVL